ncbi:MAG: hypothetical protein FJX76_07965 [Armatimonadetes bacterium]|nr:hypothetical protein [Armatimonadota bacterium]
MICPSCGSANDNGVFFCRQCRTLFLSNIDQDGAPEEGERVLDLAHACELVRSGEWSLTEFHGYLEDFEAKQAAKEGEIHATIKEIPFGLEEEFQEESQVGLEGVTSCNEAIGVLRRYDPEITGDFPLEEGLGIFFSGISRVKEAMRINRRSYGRPLWL